MKSKSIVKILFASIVVLAAALHVVLITTDAFSRAGRGSSYRSSSSSRSSSSRSYSSSSSRSSSPSTWGSSSSRSRTYIPYGSTHSSSSSTTSGTTDSSSTSGGSDWIYGLIGLAVIFGIIGLIIYLIVKVIKKALGMGGAKAGFDDSAPTQYEFNPAIAEKLKAGDPEFSPEKFMEKAKTIAERLQQSWSDGDMIPVRNYVSQGIFNRFRLQLELMVEDEGVRNIMSDYKVMKVSALALNASKSYQTIHVSLYASGRDATVPAGASEEEKQKALAATPKEAFTEVYSFTRKLGVKTNTSRDWLKGECPNCGYVPDNFSENNKCRSCGSIYNSGEFDWVLSEITQLEEWKEESSRDIEGLAELEGRNLSINREVIEDRASYLFWRWIYSRVKGTAAPLARDAVPGFIAEFPPNKHKLYNTAVGAVDLVSVKLEGEDAIAKVKILWSTASEINDEPYHHENMFTLMMPVALKNPYGLADHSCDNCGGPLPESDALKCTYCGSNLPAAVSDWLLAKIDIINWEQREGA
jgi:hypothetical protein